MRNLFSLLILCFFSILTVNAQKNPLASENPTVQKKWVDSVYNQMSVEERVGQLFMVDIFSSQGKPAADKIKELIKNYHIGGVIFSKGGPQRQAKMNNEFQELSKVPLLVAMDAEWGLAMRLDSTYAFPWNMTLGAIENYHLVRETGRYIAKHNKRLGVHINFAPVVDINTNPANPIIGNRSFGENKANVTEKAVAFMQGMHQENVLSNAKHFPGHGDTDVDSHKSLPTIPFDRDRLDSLEMYPYYEMIHKGVSSIMVAHLNVPELEPKDGLPSSLSKKIITDLLKKKLNYKGLIFTDALNMKGASNYDSPGEIELAAFEAGNDILLISGDVPKAYELIKEKVEESKKLKVRLEESVKKILSAKYKVGLHHYQAVDTTHLYQDLNHIENDLLYEELMENAITLIKNNNAILPIRKLKDTKIAYLHMGSANGDAFYHTLNKYTFVEKLDTASVASLSTRIKNYDLVIVGHHTSNDSPWKDYKFTEEELNLLHQISIQNKVVLATFSRPYALLDVQSTTNIKSIVLGYQNSKISQEKVAQAIFGAIDIKGKLPVSLGKNFPEGTQFKTKAIQRLQYGLPESVGMRSDMLQQIDSIAEMVLEDKMTPGFQVLVARKGKVIFQKNYGYHTYENKTAVTDTTIYDVASLTKILATLPLVMKLEELGEISLDTKLSELLPAFKNSDKKNITLKQMLSHYAGLKAWLPFYISTLDNKTKTASSDYYRPFKTKGFDVQVAQNLWIRNDMNDSIVKEIRESELMKKIEYKYSDLPYYLLKEYLEKYYQQNLHELTQEQYYGFLGANNTGYLPLERFDLSRIPPTEVDSYWRETTVQGYVHDQGAAMQGNIGGHAGIFSNANDVAKIMQMYLNGGSYGGKQYFKKSTIDKFNTCYYCHKETRRGLGFDKPQLKRVGPTCGCVSMKSFGHTGFTGTMAWADPEEEIVYVFLSNRTFPDAENRKLIQEDIRTKIQQIIYNAIIK
ncbi:glycoside hydrolase family 3 N-terminal domain-containing protein [Mesonia sp. K7]|uniref:glycoside hydrolase family 3 N-terminal domain-containing protein n=1 Tax=Mesonia sp. K7 TaxID=2218606 RepID=UPI000DA8CB84|nr:glycoside hydrolase family 3 N-terminal domain-containing protein [Mesonia sp. K7]PZD76469.1 beta-N-acetylglucosaminidase [Mesonia sp. K7]